MKNVVGTRVDTDRKSELNVDLRRYGDDVQGSDVFVLEGGCPLFRATQAEELYFVSHYVCDRSPIPICKLLL